jgi:glycosyltransferase
MRSVAKPSVTVVTVVKNAAATVADCVESVLGQNYPVEYIVIDGGSTDGTIDIINQYSSQISTIISGPDKSIYDGMNKGVALATGSVLGMLNADDVYAHESVIAHVAEAFQDPTIESCYGDLIYVDPDDCSRITRYWKSGPYDRNLFYNGWMPPHPTCFARRSVYERYGAFNMSLGTSADYELMLRFLLKHGITSVYIPDLMVVMRGGGVSNISVLNRWRANRADMKAWKVNELVPRRWTIVAKPLSKLLQYVFKNSRDLSWLALDWPRQKAKQDTSSTGRSDCGASRFPEQEQRAATSAP